jgi:predicted XRE-type DNA-binding protein
MPSARKIDEPGHITTGSALEDLGFSAQEIREMEIKADLWIPIRAEIESRKLRQAQLAKILEIHQPDASLLLRGQLSRFSITRLLQFAEHMGLTVTVTVAPASEGKENRNRARIPMRKASSSRRKPATPAVAARTKKNCASA